MSKYIMVDAISQFRMRYVIEVPDNHNDGEHPCTAEQWAMDTVTMQEAKEFSQEWLGETIVSAHEITNEKIITQCDVDNEYCKSWDREKKMEVFVTEVGYENKDK
jgi:hypothetical protein